MLTECTHRSAPALVPDRRWVRLPPRSRAVLVQGHGAADRCWVVRPAGVLGSVAAAEGDMSPLRPEGGVTVTAGDWSGGRAHPGAVQPYCQAKDLLVARGP